MPDISDFEHTHQHIPMESTTENIRKLQRVGKACERCRVKKSKCNGVCPCNRCSTDDTICLYGERKRSRDRTYPKGHVEIIEQQLKRVVLALQQLFAKLVNGQPWPGKKVRLTRDGQPLVHDILEGLDLLQLPDDTGSDEVFTESLWDPASPPQKLVILALQLLFLKLVNGEPWSGKTVRRAQGGQPLALDILEGLDLLQLPDDTGSDEVFTEKTSETKHKQRLWDQNAPPPSPKIRDSSLHYPVLPPPPDTVAKAPSTNHVPRPEVPMADDESQALQMFPDFTPARVDPYGSVSCSPFTTGPVSVDYHEPGYAFTTGPVSVDYHEPGYGTQPDFTYDPSEYQSFEYYPSDMYDEPHSYLDGPLPDP